MGIRPVCQAEPVPTPHLSAPDGAYADTVLMPGDPLRARYIAQSFLDGAERVSAVRAMEGWTGAYRGVRVSVQGSGMGVPSISIYATELARHYGVGRIVRVGSCGAVSPGLALRDVVVASGAGTDSGVNRARLHGRDLPAVADFELLRAVVERSEASGVPVRVGTVFTADLFYEPNPEVFDLLRRYGFLAIEMEAAGLYGVAAECGIAALTVCTVSDQLVTGERLTVDERQEGFDAMIHLVLDAVTGDRRRPAS
jgi:purine-nucleoside phosphorylase